MSETDLPGQLLFVGFEGTAAPLDLLDLVARGRVGGVIFFARNIESPAQLRALSRELLCAAPPEAPLLLGIDQEGGRVQRMRAPWSVWPSMRRVGERGDLRLTAAVARALAQELRDCGIRLDFAPVVDVDTNPDNPIIGDRSFARSSDEVCIHAAAFIRAMQEEGVAACAKHFPGHGDTRTDSHLELPVLEHDLMRLREVELPPFEAAVRAGVATIMTAHILFPELDAKYPATLSPDLLRILREEMGFDGVLFSDDLEMKAMADHFTLEEQIRGGLEAGIDAFLVCSCAELRDRSLTLLEKIPKHQLEGPLRRVRALKQRYAAEAACIAEDSESPPYAAHAALVREIDA